MAAEKLLRINADNCVAPINNLLFGIEWESFIVVFCWIPFQKVHFLQSETKVYPSKYLRHIQIQVLIFKVFSMFSSHIEVERDNFCNSCPSSDFQSELLEATNGKHVVGDLQKTKNISNARF